MKDKIFRVSYGFVDNDRKSGALESYAPSVLYAKDYDGRFVTLEEAVAIYEIHAPEENEYADYDEFLPICVEAQYFPDADISSRFSIYPVDYIIYDGNNWFIPLKEGRVKKASKDEALKWIEAYVKAVKSYDERVKALPEPTLETFFFAKDKSFYPTKEELAAMPKAE